MTLEPLIDLQARLEQCCLYKQVHLSWLLLNACVTAWLVESLVPQAVLLSLLPKHSSCNHHKHERRQYVAQLTKGVNRQRMGLLGKL
jgi:hypothetical protein